MNIITILERLGLHIGGFFFPSKGRTIPRVLSIILLLVWGQIWGLEWHWPLLVSDWTSQMATNYPEVWFVMSHRVFEFCNKCGIFMYSFRDRICFPKQQCCAVKMIHEHVLVSTMWTNISQSLCLCYGFNHESYWNPNFYKFCAWLKHFFTVLEILFRYLYTFFRFNACRMDMTCARNWARDPRGHNCTGTCVQYQQVGFGVVLVL